MDTLPDDQRRALLAFYDTGDHAEAALREIIERDFPLDRISLLGKASASGDDPLGVYYAGTGERMRGWGTLGAFWGGLWGLVTGAAGMFLVPGLGPLFAAGPIVHALVGALAGAGITGGVMAGAAAVSHLAVAIHRMGVPRERIEEAQRLIGSGHYLLMLIVGRGETGEWRETLDATAPLVLWELPYAGLGGAAKKAI